jgi:predicted GNAT family acetyltransferase
MPITVTFTDDPSRVLSDAHEFLASEPVLHNLILTLLHQRVEHPEPGRYWVASNDGEAIGVVFQSPTSFFATLTRMRPDAIEAMVDTIVAAGIDLPGVSGDAPTASRFAGQWTERCKSAAAPDQGQRMYELKGIEGSSNANGALRQATTKDRDLVIEWMRGFQSDTRELVRDPSDFVGPRLAEGQYWIWEDGEPISMASASPVIEGVSRIGSVYTPPDRRNRGYAESCVRELSQQLLSDGVRPMLYTDLANPTSNSIYRRIGYRAVAEVLRYRFE